MHDRYTHQGRTYDIQLDRQGSGYTLTVDGQSHPFEVLDEQPGQLTLLFAGRPVTLYWAIGEGNRKWVSLDGCSYLLEKPAARSALTSAGDSGDSLRAPMPAQVLSMLVAEGDEVQQGQTLALLEAMKMEIRLRSPRAGRVAAILAGEGASVERGQIVIKLG